MKLKRVLAALLTPFIMLLNCPLTAVQASDLPAVKQTTEIFHKPVEAVEAGKRIILYTEISDQNVVDVVRVYFKSRDGADYSFVEMKPVINQEKGYFERFQNIGSDFKGLGYSCVLPAPANGSRSFEYCVLVKNTANVVVKSQTYTVMVADDKVGGMIGQEPIKIYSELERAPLKLAGFSDSLTIDLIEYGSRFGVVAGLYPGLDAAGEGAIAGGTVVASSGGFTTTAAVVSAAAAIAVVGGVAAIAGGGGGGSGDGGGTSSGGQQVTASWIITGVQSYANYSPPTGSKLLSAEFSQTAFNIDSGHFRGTYTSDSQADVVVTNVVQCDTGIAAHYETHSATTTATINDKIIALAEFEIVSCESPRLMSFKQKWIFTK
ncbi:MAG: hypothetical protein KJ630_12880 [Proteobacteria bacterium]|nr:hypothetical protein [Pseudomonadota bacterium]